MTLKRMSALLFPVLLLVGTLASPAFSDGDTSPVPYSAQGSSWVTVPEIDKIYFEDFDDGDNSLQYDDHGIAYIPDGQVCDRNSRSTTGPALVTTSISDCGDGYDPYDKGTRAGAIPLGFTINFFGVEYDSVYANTNGSITFDSAFSRYDDTAFDAVQGAESSILFAYSVDLEHRIYSNFWYAQTTIGGQSAAVFSWENYAPYSNDDTAIGAGTEENSFQIVIISQGNKDFDAWFNYDEIETNSGDSEGYDAYHFWIDLSDDVTVGSNVVRVNYASTLPEGCTYYWDVNRELSSSGSFTDSNWQTKTASNNFYAKRESASTMTFWEDSGCTSTPINALAVQDTGSDGNAYMEYSSRTGIEDYAATIGWGTYVASPFKIEATELFPNVSLDTLLDGGANELISQSINTSVVGRIVLGQRDGETVGDPSDPDSPVLTSSTSTPEPSAPRPPLSARFDAYSVGLSDSGSPQLAIEGKRFWCISSMTVDGMDIPFTSGFSTPWYEYLNADLSGVTPGKKTLVVQSCMGKVTYTNWFTIPSPVEPKSMWTKVSSFGLSEAAKAKIAAFNSSLGDGYTRIRCIVNSANGDDMNEALVAQVCTFANSNDASDAIAVLETRDSFAGSGYWINIWVSGN